MGGRQEQPREVSRILWGLNNNETTDLSPGSAQAHVFPCWSSAVPTLRSLQKASPPWVWEIWKNLHFEPAQGKLETLLSPAPRTALVGGGSGWHCSGITEATGQEVWDPNLTWAYYSCSRGRRSQTRPHLPLLLTKAESYPPWGTYQIALGSAGECVAAGSRGQTLRSTRYQTPLSGR